MEERGKTSLSYGIFDGFHRFPLEKRTKLIPFLTGTGVEALNLFIIKEESSPLPLRLQRKDYFLLLSEGIGNINGKAEPSRNSLSVLFFIVREIRLNHRFPFHFFNENLFFFLVFPERFYLHRTLRVFPERPPLNV